MFIMPSHRPKIVTDELYHVYNRSVEKRIVFPTKHHYNRFLAAIRFFNTTEAVTLREFLTAIKTGVQPLRKVEIKPIVEVGAFIFMPTHYHLLLRPLVDGGIPLFMQKIGSGYTGFFNLKHDRSGPLFQGRYKIKHINSDQYARHIQAYIALNALDEMMPEWRESGIKDQHRAYKILIEHPWSSFSSYVGENRFPGIINQKFILDFFDDIQDFERFTISWAIKDGEFISETVAG